MSLETTDFAPYLIEALAYTPPARVQKPHNKHNTHTNRDDRVRIKTLHEAGYKPLAIQQHLREHRQLQLSLRQVRYALDVPQTPKKRRGAPVRLAEGQVDQIEQFVMASLAHRSMTYKQLAQVFTHLNAGEYAIRSALERRGYKRCKVRSKPPISEKNQCLRLEFPESRKH